MSLIDLGGHSLGAAHALIAAGMLTLDGAWEPGEITTCGSPAPGGRELQHVLSLVNQNAYRNAGDPVWDVPTQPPFVHPTDAIILGDPGQALDFSQHRIAFYQAGVPPIDKPFVDLIAALYNPQPGDFDAVRMTSGVFWGLKKPGPAGRPALIFRGSVTDEDWTRDFVALPVIDPAYWRLGMLHAGFTIGVAPALKAALALL